MSRPVAAQSDVLLVIDMLVGFCRPGGALYLMQDTTRLESYIHDLAGKFLMSDGRVAFCSDEHDPTDSEFEQFPHHCMKGTPECEVVPSLRDIAEGATTIPKRSFSALRGTSLFAFLKKREIGHVHLTGVATDICILFTSQDLRAEGFAVSVHRDGVMASQPARQEFFLQYMEDVLGVDVV